MNSINCPSCGKPSPSGTQFCRFCGQSISQVNPPIPQVGGQKTVSTCPHCGGHVRIGVKFCASCGKPLAMPIPQPPHSNRPVAHLRPQPSHLVSNVSSSSKPIPGLTGRLPPQTILNNRYAIIHKVGQGGMAAVYQATDTRQPGRLWAVKEMSESMISDPQERKQAVQAFHREANLLAKLDHPNLPQVIDSFAENGRQYLVMEYIHGQTLEKLIVQRTSSFSEMDILPWVKQLCDVLSYLHNHQPQPIIFRDLKPSNIMVMQTGRIKLIDFGIVRFFKPGKKKDTEAIGTMGYIAPEARSGQTDARSDIYSLCVVTHELLTCHDPTTTPWQYPPVRTLNSAVSLEWAGIIERGLEHKRENRWPDANTLKQEFLSTGTSSVRPYQVKTPKPQIQKPVRVTRPTTRLIQAAVQLSFKQLAMIMGGLITILFVTTWLLTPIISEFPYNWENVPIMALFGALGYASYPKRGVTFITHTLLSIALVSTIWLRLGIDYYAFSDLVIGAALSGALMEAWVWFMPEIKTTLNKDDIWKGEMAWLASMAVVGNAVFLGLLTDWRLGIHIVLWFFAALLGALGWFLGDLVHEAYLCKTGFHRKP